MGRSFPSSCRDLKRDRRVDLFLFFFNWNGSLGKLAGFDEFYYRIFAPLGQIFPHFLLFIPRWDKNDDESVDAGPPARDRACLPMRNADYFQSR